MNTTPSRQRLALARRKVLYEARWPETRHGGTPGKAGGGKKPKDDTMSSFADDTATKTGTSARSVQRHVKIGEALRATAASEAKPLFEAEARERMLATQNNDAGRAAGANLPEQEKGRARDHAATMFNVSARYVSRLARSPLVSASHARSFQYRQPWASLRRVYPDAY